MFPNPASGPKSQFYGFTPREFSSSKIYKELFKDKTKYKEKGNFECAACHQENQQPITVGGVRFQQALEMFRILQRKRGGLNIKDFRDKLHRLHNLDREGGYW